MDFAFSAEQEEFRASLRRFLTERAPLSAVREWSASDAGYDPRTWGQLCEQLGLASLHIPEEFGGAGYGLLEAAVASEELGRALTPAPYFGGAVAAAAILAAGTDEQRKEPLPAIASGETIATIAASEPGRATGPGTFSTAAVRRGDEFTLDGVKAPVEFAHAADVILVVAQDPEGAPGATSLFVVRGDADGVRRERLDSLDLTRPFGRVTLQGVTATRLGDGPTSATVAARVQDVARTLLAWEMVGGAQRCLEMSVQYAKDRYQFNRPIGSFQAIKHRCADMAVEIDAARAAASFAVYAASTDSDELRIAAPLAKAQAADAFSFAAGANIQIHGGIGFTWEHDAHLYYRRAQSDALLYGSSADNRALLADRAGI